MSKSSVLVNWFLVRAVPGGKEKIMEEDKKITGCGDTSGNLRERGKNN
tara:strand:+ start:55 stop:198 length:144 start_codon:yes stop_codon:yes gene_type:complete